MSISDVQTSLVITLTDQRSISQRVAIYFDIPFSTVLNDSDNLIDASYNLIC